MEKLYKESVGRNKNWFWRPKGRQLGDMKHLFFNLASKQLQTC
jgi:hypothetical protein